MREFISYRWMKKHVLYDVSDSVLQSYKELLANCYVYGGTYGTISVFGIMNWIWSFNDQSHSGLSFGFMIGFLPLCLSGKYRYGDYLIRNKPYSRERDRLRAYKNHDVKFLSKHLNGDMQWK